MGKSNVFKLLLCLVISLTFSSSFVSSIGIGFSQDVEINPGQTLESSLQLQNLPVGNGNLIFKGKVEQGGEIVSFSEEEYRVDEGMVRLVPISITIPEGAVIGQEYYVKITFTTSTPKGEDSDDTVQFNPGAGILFRVKVVSDKINQRVPYQTEQAKFSGLLWLVVGIIVIAISIITVVLFRMRKKSSLATPGTSNKMPGK